MIRAYSRLDANPTHNGNVLTALSADVREDANGVFDLTMTLTKSQSVSRGDLILCPTPRGNQYFRVYRTVPTLSGITVYANHIFYDLSNNFLVDSRPENQTCAGALNTILTAAETANGFTASSDITDIATAYYIRMNPVMAIMSADNSILKTWGGCLIRDNYTVTINATGNDRGYEIRLGKNLIGVEDDSDESAVVTRLYPTIVLGDGNTVYALPEKYVDSPLLGNYGDPRYKEIRIALTDEQKLLDIDDIYEIMRDYCKEQFSYYHIDAPIANYRINFIELSKTEEYKNLAILEELDLYDIVHCKVTNPNIDVSVQVISYTYDAVKQRYKSIQLGQQPLSSSYTTAAITQTITEKAKKTDDVITYVNDLISGNMGGFKVEMKYPNGVIYETLYMDTEDINTAQNVIRINKSGVGFSKSGYNGPFTLAATIDGIINADFIQAGTMSADRVRAGILQSLSGALQINLNNDTMAIDKTGANTKTVIDEAGLEVLDKTGSTEEALLFAGIDSNGEGNVTTKNLKATKYLLAGTHARFEDYSTNRTGIFYV